MAGRRGATDGQALVELAVGMLAFAVVLSGLLAVGRIAIAWLDVSRPLRARAGRAAMGSHGGYSSATGRASVDVPLRAFRRNTIELKEEVHMPAMGLDFGEAR